MELALGFHTQGRKIKKNISPQEKKMAPTGEEQDPERILQNVEIVGLDNCVMHIIKKCGSKSRSAVMSELADIDIELLKDSRLLLFALSKERYEEQLAQYGINDAVTIEPKNRRKMENVTGDIVDLYLYDIGVRPDYPRHVLKDVTVYREISVAVEEAAEEESDEVHESDETKSDATTENGEDTGRNNEESENMPSGDGTTEPSSEENSENGGNEGEANAAPRESLNQGNQQNPPPNPNCVHPECKAEFQKLWKYIKEMERKNNERIEKIEKNPSLSPKKADEPKPKPNPPKPSSKKSESTPKQQTESKPSQEEFDDFGFDPGASSSGSPAAAATNNAKKSGGGGGLFPPAAKKKFNGKPPVPPAGRSQNETQQNQRGKKHLTAGGANKFPNKSKKNLTASQNHRGRTVEMYLPNITKHSDDTYGEIAERVRDHARTRGLFVITSKIIRNKFNENIVGCLITVPERQQDDALGNRIWPEGMKCRRWQDRSKNDGVGSRQFYNQNYNGEYNGDFNHYQQQGSDNYFEQYDDHYDENDHYHDFQNEHQYYNSWEDRYEYYSGQ